jgi:hypothetical protein
MLNLVETVFLSGIVGLSYTLGVAHRSSGWKEEEVDKGKVISNMWEECKEFKAMLFIIALLISILFLSIVFE